jgi:hypothetical protein
MFFSRKKREVGQSNESNVQDKVAKGIAGLLLSIQNRFTSFMSARINSLSSRSKRVCLGFFCLIFGGFSVHVFFGAFDDSGNSGKTIKPDQVVVPKYYNQADTDVNESLVTEKDIMRINRFKIYMDSLSLSTEGKAEYDSILKERPGLMDSIKAIEGMYYSQSK